MWTSKCRLLSSRASPLCRLWRMIDDGHIVQPNSSRTFDSSAATPVSAAECTQFHPRRVLVLTKLTRLEFEKRTHPDLNEEQLKNELSKRGSDYSRLFERHEKHKAFLEVIERELSDAKIETRVVDRFAYDEASVGWADAVFSAGGDGTFLLAASRVSNNRKPVIGINTDPTGSEGYLCLFQTLTREHFKEALSRLLSGSFQWLYRQRIRVKLRGDAGRLEHLELHEQQLNPEAEKKWKKIVNVNDLVLPQRGRGYDSIIASPEHELVLPELALNDVFMGESHSSRVSYYEMQFDDCEAIKQKSSGVTVCTGTGSTSWFFNINKVTDQCVSDLLKIASKELPAQLPYNDPQTVDRICKTFNNSLVFSPTDPRLAYSVRDPVHNSIYRPFAPRGFARKLRIRSRCYDAHLVIDGGVAYKFNDGAEAVLEIHPDDALKTVVIR